MNAKYLAGNLCTLLVYADIRGNNLSADRELPSKSITVKGKTVTVVIGDETYTITVNKTAK